MKIEIANQGLSITFSAAQFIRFLNGTTRILVLVGYDLGCGTLLHGPAVRLIITRLGSVKACAVFLQCAHRHIHLRQNEYFSLPFVFNQSGGNGFTNHIWIRSESTS